MPQAIVTKYIAPTNTKPSRVRATAQAGNILMSWDYELDVSENHAKAAKMLADKFKWKGNFIGGQMPNGGYCFTQEQDYCKFVAFGE